MQSYVSATFQSLDCAGGVCVVDGYGVQVRVRNRCLIVSDGIGRFRRERSFAKAFCHIKRLIVVSHEGAITLEALRWLTDAGVSFTQIDRDGELIAASANYGLNDPRLRRALALATTNSSGLEIARYVLCAKLAGQEMNLSRPLFPENARAGLTAARKMAEKAFSLAEILAAESSGAAAYWGAWQDVSPRFAKKDEKSIPEHWRNFGQRGSPITGSPRRAANPANAMLNYLYALLEAETRLACLACGLDPGLGVFHADQKSRDSLVLDLMEAVRPQVDDYLLDLLAARTLQRQGFCRDQKGRLPRTCAPDAHPRRDDRPMGAHDCARGRMRRCDTRRKIIVADRTTDSADSGASQYRARRCASQPEGVDKWTRAQTDRDLHNLRRTTAERRASILRRLSTRRTPTARNEFHSRGHGGACEDAGRRSRPDG